MATPFDIDLEHAQYRLQEEERRGRLIRIFTLGLFRNEGRIHAAQCELIRCEKDVVSFEQLEARASSVDHGLRETTVIPGARLSERTIVDMPTLASTDYGPEWETIREQILDRDGHECSEADGRCEGPLQVHHRIPLSKRGTHNQNNLITLCEYHHSLKHPHMRGHRGGRIWR